MTAHYIEIKPEDIQQLDAANLVRLLHRLLHCEARALGLAKHGILVPCQITVADGGSDGEWRADYAPSEYIPRTWTRYQCKASLITVADCRAEIAPTKSGKTIVKPRVQEVLKKGGCFAFFSSEHEIKRAKKADIVTIARKEMLKAGFKPAAKAQIEFFGDNRIADWVNSFPAAVRFVRQVTKGIGPVHFLTYDDGGRRRKLSGLT